MWRGQWGLQDAGVDCFERGKECPEEGEEEADGREVVITVGPGRRGVSTVNMIETGRHTLEHRQA